MPEQWNSSLIAKSRRFKEGRKWTEKLWTPDSHVGGEVGGKIMVYNTRRDQKKNRERKKTRKKKERESKRLKKYNSKKEEFSTFDHITRACPRILFVLVHAQLFPFNTIFQYLFPRFRLAFFPTLYKFIVWAFCLSPFLFWVQVKTSPYTHQIQSWVLLV